MRTSLLKEVSEETLAHTKASLISGKILATREWRGEGVCEGNSELVSCWVDEWLGGSWWLRKGGKECGRYTLAFETVSYHYCSVTAAENRRCWIGKPIMPKRITLITLWLTYAIELDQWQHSVVTMPLQLSATYRAPHALNVHIRLDQSSSSVCKINGKFMCSQPEALLNSVCIKCVSCTLCVLKEHTEWTWGLRPG